MSSLSGLTAKELPVKLKYVAKKAIRDQPAKKKALRPRLWLLVGGIFCMLLATICFDWRDQPTHKSRPEGAAASPASLAGLSEDELARRLRLPTPTRDEAVTSLDIEAWTTKLDTALGNLDADLPSDAQAAHLHGLIDVKLKRTQLAEPNLRRAVELASDSWEMKSDLAELLSQLGRDDEALAALSAASLPTLAAHWLQLGDCRLHVGQLDQAIDAYQHAVASDAQNSNAWLKLALAQLQQKQYVDCETSCRRALEIKQDSFEAWSTLARSLSLQSRAEEAKAAVARARALNDSNSERPREEFEVAHARSMSKVIASAFRSLGILYQSKGKLNKSDAMLQMALQADPQDLLALSKRAALMRSLGEWELAADLHRRLASQEPTEFAHYQNLANLSMQLNRPHDAEAALRLACKRIPNNGNCQLLLAKFLLLLNKPQEAVAPARVAVELLNNDDSKQLYAQVLSLKEP